MAVTFESYDRRINQIKPVMEQYGIKDFEDALKICTDLGFNPYEIVKGVQPICFENAAWAYTLGAAIAVKKGCNKASEAAKAIGIGLQNFPEGSAVSIPLRREGYSRGKSFMFGQASAIVEPIAGVLGAALVSMVETILPFALSFAAGAMIYAVIKELSPIITEDSESNIGIISFGMGFSFMMILDVALG